MSGRSVRVFRRRWSRRSKLLIALAALCALASFALVRGYQARLEALRPAVGPSVPVVVAAQTLARGVILTEGALAVERMPSAFAPPGALGSLEEALGGTLASDLAEGEVLTRTRLGATGGPVASLVPSGLRAVTVPSGMPVGAVRPGDRVDVLATFGGPHPHAETTATGLEVLMVLDPPQDTFAASGAEGPTLVLLVSPDTAERLAYAKAFATLTVVVAGVGP
jgi:Flp pilus assembly protein CpaB